LKNFFLFLRYSIVGVLGTAIDVGSLYVFVNFLNIPIMFATGIAFLLAVTNNFFLNKTWTFKHPSKNYRKLYIKFLSIALVGLSLTLSSMYILVYPLAMNYIIAKLLTSLIVLTWNFLGNKLWTFQINKNKLSLKNEFDYDLSIVIPAYNEEKRLENTMKEIKQYIINKDLNAEIIIVDDGSKDATVELANNLKNNQRNIKVIALKKNKGKGFAVKVGVKNANGRYILFTDADNSTPIAELDKLMSHRKNAKVIIGSRYVKDAKIKIKQSKYRLIISRLGNLLIKFLIIDGIKDTQCGFKLFHNHAAKEIFHLQKVKRFGFDIEALMIARNLDYKIIETPVNWFNSADSRVRPIRDSLIILKDLFFIKINLWTGRYDRD
jgi:dolichyl-phosphate beta-glucosyltransferase